MGRWGIRCPPIGVNTAEAVKGLGVSPGSVTGAAPRLLGRLQVAVSSPASPGGQREGPEGEQLGQEGRLPSL